MFKKIKNAFKFRAHKKNQFKQNRSQQNQQQNIPQNLLQQVQEQVSSIAQIDREYENYQVNEGDSLYGIALNYDMSAELLKRINHLSSDQIFPGMTIKVFKQFNELENQEEIIENQNDNDEEIDEHDFLKLSQIPMYYCMDDQNVKGELSLREDMILFNTNQSQYTGKRAIYNSCISLRDINEAKTHILPNPNGQKDFIVQILLSGVGREKFEQKFRKKLLKLKKKRQSIATVFFRHQERDEQGILYPEEIKREICQNLTDIINELVLNHQDGQQILSLTKLPYIDLIDESNQYTQLIQKEQLDHVIGKRMGRIWASIAFVPQYNVNSQCLNESLYKQLIELLPAIYRLANWKISFSIDVDGSSYEQMLLKMEYQSPFIFTVKDKQNNVFGAYVSSTLQSPKQGFHGTGETFLFQIQDLKINPYYWKETNTDFVFCQQEGFGVGCGPSFGLYIDSKFYYGYCNPCSTFENPRFTDQEKFFINHLEFWTLEQL